MESYGAILRKAREEKELTLETVERDTSITKLYLEALETEEVNTFPGEPYLIGFLRNYADYLGVDSAEVIKLYHAKKIQESPVPEGLLEKHRPRWIIPLIVALSLLVIAGITFGVMQLVKSIQLRKIEAQKIIEQNSRTRQYPLTLKGETKRLYKGDQILISAGEGKGNIVVTVEKTIGSLFVQTPAGTQIIDLSEERELDVDGDGIKDIILYLSDISATNEERGAEVRMLAKSPEAAVNTEPEVSENEIVTSAALNQVSKNVKQTLIIEDSRAYPFTVGVTFRGACVFRYKVDRDEYIEDYFTSGDIINVTASNTVRLWMSNVNAMKIQIIANGASYDLDVGKAGQVKAEDIRWVKEQDGKYRLLVVELD